MEKRLAIFKKMQGVSVTCVFLVILPQKAFPIIVKF